MKPLIAFLFMAAIAWCQPGGAANRVVTGPSLPATCSVGQIFFKSTATTGMSQCTATNTWTVVPLSGGTGDVTGPASATAGDLPTLDATGKVLADSGIAATTVVKGAAALSTATAFPYVSAASTLGQAQGTLGLTWETNTSNNNGAIGPKLDKVSSNAFFSSYIYSIDGSAKWAHGIDSANADYVLLYDYSIPADIFRVCAGGKFVVSTLAGSPCSNTATFEIQGKAGQDELNLTTLVNEQRGMNIVTNNNGSGAAAVVNMYADGAAGDLHLHFYGSNFTNKANQGWLFTTGASSPLVFGTSGTARWTVSTAGHLIGAADNTYDIGANGATRPRTGYFGTSVLTPLVNAATGFQIGGAAASGHYLRGNATNYVDSTIQSGDLPAQYRQWESCGSRGVGDGLNAIAAGTYLQFSCVNDTGVTVTITGVHCWTDNAGTSTLNLANNAATGLLTGAVTCNATKASGGAAGTQSATTTLANGDAISFTFVADGTSKQTNWTISGTY